MTHDKACRIFTDNSIDIEIMAMFVHGDDRVYLHRDHHGLDLVLLASYLLNDLEPT